MRRRLIALVLTPLLACRETPLPPDPASVDPWNAATIRLFAATCRQSAEGRVGNVGLFAPALLPLLSVLAEGARGETREQLVAALGAPDHESNRRRLRGLERLDDADFASGFQLWLDRSLPAQDAWLELVTGRERYDAELVRIDFANCDRAAVVRDVNEWVAGLVEQPVEALSADDLDPLTRLILTSAARVRWQWTDEFEPSHTRPAPFYARPDRTEGRPVPTMHGEQEHARAGEIDGCLAVEIACADGLRLDLIKVGGDRAKRDALLASDGLVGRLDAEFDRRGTHSLEIALPKVATATLHELGPVLQSLGARDAFSSNADFSGIGGKPGELLLSLVRHGCGVEWDEEGGRAYGFTTTMAVAAEVSRSIEFDEPFLAFLRGPDGAIVLAEWIEDPGVR